MTGEKGYTPPKDDGREKREQRKRAKARGIHPQKNKMKYFFTLQRCGWGIHSG
jgi:hypothetical protein